jgi:hypothetical protein
MGAQVKCPKCRTALIVPNPDETAPDADLLPGDSPATDEVWADVTAFDQPPAAPLAKSVAGQFSTSSEAGGDPSIILLPRRMLYLQGVLLAVVAILAFVAGYLIGGGVRLSAP